MRHGNKCCSHVCAVAVLTFAAVSAHAAGFDLPDQDAFAGGRGMAFAATADNPSAIYFNPAGITQLQGHNLRGGVYGLHLGATYRNPTTGSSHDNEDPWHAVPQFFYTYGPENLPLAFGLGLYSPYGLSTKWPQDTGFRTVATEGALTYFTVNPVVALKVLPNLSVGAGLTMNYADMDLRQGLVWPAQPFDGFRFKGDGWDVGYNLGLLWKPHEKVSIGVSFRSTTTVNLEGRTEFYNDVATPDFLPAFPQQRVGAEASFPFPLNAIFGISYRPTPQWNFEFDADYTGWNRLGTVIVQQATPFPPLLPKDILLPLNWESSWYYEFGATRYFGNGWSISGGYIFNENSVPDAHYTPLVADLNRHFLSVGTGHKGEHFSFDVAYQFGYGPTRTVAGGTPADGRYEFISHAIFLSFGWHF